MQSKEVILETDQYGHFIYQPDLPPNKYIKAIFMIQEDKSETTNTRRKPSPVIMGKGRITGDIMTPAESLEDWEVLQ